jgi:hypothetical protein
MTNGTIVTVIQHSYAHLFDWESLWAQHNENRVLFPNLIVVLLAHTAHFNITVEEYLSAIMLVVATALLIWAHKRRSASTPWLYYVPVVFLALSTVQYENALWGFQMAWYLVLFSMATAVVLVDRVTLTWLVLIGAIAAAVIGSFSSLQGLLIWPAGLLLLYHRRRPLRFVIVWFVAAMVSAIIYFYNFNTNATSGSPSHGYALQHPLAAIKFYVFEVGDIVGLPRVYNGPGSNPVLLLGVVILVLAVLTLIAYGIRRDEEGGGPVGVALICVGLLFVAIVTTGRIPLRLSGCQCISVHDVRSVDPDRDLLDNVEEAGLGDGTPTLPCASGPRTGSGKRATPHRGRSTELDRSGPGSGSPLGPRRSHCRADCLRPPLWARGGPNRSRQYQAQAAHVLRNIDHESDGHAGVLPLDLLESPAFIRRQAQYRRKSTTSSPFAPGVG